MSYLTIERDLAIEPGETKDLGTLKFGKNGKPIKSELTDEKAKKATVRAAPLAGQRRDVRRPSDPTDGFATTI